MVHPAFCERFRSGCRVLRCVLRGRVGSGVQMLVRGSVRSSLLHLLFAYLSGSGRFCGELCLVRNPGSFSRLVFRFVCSALLELLGGCPLGSPTGLRVLDHRAVTQFCAFKLTSSMGCTVVRSVACAPRRVTTTCSCLVRGSTFSLIRRPGV